MVAVTYLNLTLATQKLQWFIVIVILVIVTGDQLELGNLPFF
jgi:hypothetical protein